MNTNAKKREYVDEVLIPGICKFSLTRLSSFRMLVFDIFVFAIFLFQHFPFCLFPSIRQNVYLSIFFLLDIITFRSFYFSVFLLSIFFNFGVFSSFCLILLSYDIFLFDRSRVYQNTVTNNVYIMIGRDSHAF